MEQASSLPDPRPAVRDLVSKTSINATSRRLGIPREQVARLAGGLDVRPATLALARERLAQMATETDSRTP